MEEALSDLGPEASASANLLLMGVLLASVRLAGFLGSIPAFSSRLLPVRLRLAVAFVLVVSLVATSPRWLEFWEPSLAHVLSGADGVGSWGLALAAEFVVGWVLGWGVFLLLAAVRAAAMFLSDQIGFSIGGVIDPQAESSDPTLRTFHELLAVFLFVALDMHHAFVALAFESLEALPPGSLLGSAEPFAVGAFLLSSAGELFRLGALLALPVTVTLFLVTVAQAVLGRAFPELELFALGFPLRVLVGVGVLALTLPFWADHLDAMFGRALGVGRQWILEIAA